MQLNQIDHYIITLFLTIMTKYHKYVCHTLRQISSNWTYWQKHQSQRPRHHLPVTRYNWSQTACRKKRNVILLVVGRLSATFACSLYERSCLACKYLQWNLKNWVAHQKWWWFAFKVKALLLEPTVFKGWNLYFEISISGFHHTLQCFTTTWWVVCCCLQTTSMRTWPQQPASNQSNC